jgi:protein ImuB
MFGILYAAEANAEMLAAVAREFSPRIEVCGPREVTLDLSGLARLFGDARSIAEELRRSAADRQLRIRVAIAATRTAARLLVRHRAGLTIVEPGTEAAVLATLPIDLLAAFIGDEEQPPNAEPPNPKLRNAKPSNQEPRERPNPNRAHEPGTRNLELGTLRRWGLRTLGDFTALPADAVAARFGQEGVRWQRLARGEDAMPLVPAVPEEQFEQALDLEWPIDGLEPLSFVLGRLLEPLSAHLARRDRGAAVLHVRLHLVTRELHERSLQLPAPMRDARTLRTLALLDLESHPPPAAIDRVVVAVDPTPERVLQFSLLTRPQPSPEQVSTLMARLSALMGEGRCGSPVTVDSWQPGAFALKPFAPVDSNVVPAATRRSGVTDDAFGRGFQSETADALGGSVSPPGQAPDGVHRPVVALRRLRVPVIARVQVEHGKPVRVTTDRRGLEGGRVDACAGPWRTSGAWWADGWDRDEWEVTLGDGATYRVFRGRDDGRWFVDGVVD